jgi:hypothetical protein
MRTKILVTVLMLITVAAAVQAQRRDGSSNSNGKTTGRTVEEKKKSSDQGNTKDSKVRTTSSETKKTDQNRESRTNSRNTDNTHRDVNRSSDNNSRETRVINEKEKTTRTNENQNSQNNQNTNSRTERTVTSGSNGNTQGRRIQNDPQPENRVVDRNTRNENDSRNGSGRNVQTTVNRNIPVDTRVNERRYANSSHNRVEAHIHTYYHNPDPIEYRRIHNPYRRPVYVDLYWTSGLRDNYYSWYPEYRHWNRNLDSRIETISAYDSYDYIGDIARVYGKVYDVQYSVENDEYYLYFGAYYPYQDFSAVVPGWVAREITSRPKRYFDNRHISITGLITIYDDRPEIEVRRPGQIDRYY